MKEILIGYIQGQLLGGPSNVSLTDEDDLLQTGFIDSMGMMSLIAFIEKRCEIKIPPQDMTVENFVTVRAIIDYVDRKKQLNK